MKSVVIYPDNVFKTYNQDEWDSFRSEGRFVINIGYGLSLIGYNVNIAFNQWDQLKEPKVTWNNVILSQNPIKDYYDFALTFSAPSHLKNSKFGKGIIMGYEPKHIRYTKELMDETGISLTFVCPFKYGMDSLTEDDHKNKVTFPIHYLPTVFPIPHINRGFLPYLYNPNFPELKVYIHYAGWPMNFSASGERFAHKEQLIIDLLRRKGYDVKLYIHVGSRHENPPNAYNIFVTHKDCPINIDGKKDNINYFYNIENNYLGMINLLKSVDICITVGSPMFGGNCLNDIISLGKPLIYIAESVLRPGERTANGIYNAPNDLIYIQEPDSDSIAKLERFISSPKESYDRYNDLYKDYDFNNWKDTALKIFN